jgi:hypothetical protein
MSMLWTVVVRAAAAATFSVVAAGRYLAGAGLGGLYGAFTGIRATESRIFKIKLNGMVNGIEGGVSRTGNALGVLALVYSLVDASAEGVGLANKLPLGEYADDVMPVISATVTGLLCVGRRSIYSALTPPAERADTSC